MQVHTYDVTHGTKWISKGWQLFKLKPWHLIGINLFFVVTEATLEWSSPVPYLGEALGAVYTTFYYAGLLTMLDGLQRTKTLNTNLLLSAVTDRALLKRILPLAAIYCGVMLGLSTTFKYMIKTQTSDPLMITAAAFVVLSMAVLFSFSGPLIALKGTPLLQTIQPGLQANIKNMLPLLVLGIFGLLWGVVAILPIGLGLLAYLPLMHCVYYAVYLDIFDRQ